MVDDQPRADPLEFTLRWPVRGYELDSNGHVNNAVYLSWAEELATSHAEAAHSSLRCVLIHEIADGHCLVRKTGDTHWNGWIPGPSP